ncbi:MAG TPA: trypsin-like serine protease [Pirellulales bacterium]|jgi:hypothetical protein
MESEQKPDPLLSAYGIADQLIGDRATKTSVPILVEIENQVRQHGTGTLFRIGDKSFLVTAAHVVTSADAGGHPLVFGRLEGGGVFVVEDVWTITRPDRPGEKDFRDIAIMQLGHGAVEFFANHDFVRLANVDPRMPNRGDLFCVYGFPNETSTPGEFKGQKGELRPIKLHTGLYEGSTADFETYRSSHHILLNARKSNICGDSGGQFDFPERLNGISGCGIWRTLSAASGYQAVDEPNLIAVQTVFYAKARVMRGTSWHTVLSLFQMQWPELLRAAAIWLPPRARGQ